MAAVTLAVVLLAVLLACALAVVGLLAFTVRVQAAGLRYCETEASRYETMWRHTRRELLCERRRRWAIAAELNVGPDPQERFNYHAEQLIAEVEEHLASGGNGPHTPGESTKDPEAGR